MVGHNGANHVIDADAPSAARVVYNHFGGAAAFPSIRPDLMAAVDKADSARFSRDDILDPKGWVMLNFLMDSRTRPRPFPRFPDLELRADDAAHRAVPRPRNR